MSKLRELARLFRELADLYEESADIDENMELDKQEKEKIEDELLAKIVVKLLKVEQLK